MKNILSTITKQKFQIIASYNGTTEDFSDARIVLYHRTIHPTKSNKFIPIEMTKSQLIQIISLFKEEKEEVIELYSNASCINYKYTYQFVSTSDIGGSNCSIELEKNTSILNFFDKIILSLESKNILEDIYTCRHALPGALTQENGKCKCSICEEKFKLDIKEKELEDSISIVIDALQASKAINVELTNDEVRYIAKIILYIKEVSDIYKRSLEVFNKYQ